MTGEASQEVTNAVLLVEIRHLGEKIDTNQTANREALHEIRTDQQDHEKRLRSLEESSAVYRYAMGVWNSINTLGVMLAAALGLK